MKPIRAVVRLAVRSVVVFSATPFAELLTWVGTLFGGIVVSGAQGQLPTILVGAVIVLVSVSPLAIQGAIQARGNRRDTDEESRMATAFAFSILALRLAAQLESATRARRIRLAEDAIQQALDHIIKAYFSGNTRIRTVYFSVSPDRSRLEPSKWSGRKSDPARAFDSTADSRGAIALARLNEVYSPVVYRVDQIPEDWGATGRDYRAFVSIPIRSRRDDGQWEAFGTLTIDTTDQKDLSETDASALEIYATAISFYLTSAARGRHTSNDRNGGRDDH